MSKSHRAVLGCLGVAGLGLVLAVLNWNTLAMHVIEALNARSEKTTATLFRWGELMSMSAALNEEYGTEPDLTYETDTGDRVLSIVFSNYGMPQNVAANDHAREIAAFAIGETKKFDQIDVVRVVFQDPSQDGANQVSGPPEPLSFRLEELMSVQP